MLRVLYLVFNEGYSGDVDLAAEAIRLTRQLAAKVSHEEVAGLLALMLLHHARRPARTGPDGRLVPLIPASSRVPAELHVSCSRLRHALVLRGQRRSRGLLTWAG